MGPFVQLNGLTLVIWPRATNDASSELHWHRDPWGHVPSAYERPLGLNAISYLQDLDDVVGPLRVVPGSHSQPFTMPTKARQRPHGNEVLIYPRCGDVVVMHHNLVHSRTPNQSARTRSYVSVLYNLSWLRSNSQFGGCEAQRILSLATQYNDHRMMRLLGSDPDLEERANSGFLSDDAECWREWIREDRSRLAVSQPVYSK